MANSQGPFPRSWTTFLHTPIGVARNTYNNSPLSGKCDEMRHKTLTDAAEGR